MSRSTWMFHLIVIGFVVQAASYFLLATPWGFPPNGIDHSDPRLPFAPLLFLLGVVLVLLGALVYEILPERQRK